jgi:hypothetical protein
VTRMTDIFFLVFGHALVWGAGIALLLAVPAVRLGGGSSTALDTEPGEWAWIVGTGWFVGALLLTLVMRLDSAVGVAFGRAAIGLPLAAVGAVAAVFAWRAVRTDPARRPLAACAREFVDAALGKDLVLWQRVLWWLLLGWLAIRFGVLLAEVMTRPLYAWDSWIQWATKARVWFELRSMVPFGPMHEWLPANGALYFDAAPHYPATVPLWQVWSAVLLGRWDDSLTNSAWWCTGLALTVAAYGFLRGAGCGRLAALAGAGLIATLPILNAHIALAGYADLPIAACITLATLAGWRFARTRGVRELVLLVALLAALPTLKNPGKAWIFLLLPGVLVGFSPRWGLRMAAVMLGAGALAMLVLAQTDPVVLGYRLHLNWNLPWQSLVDAYFVYANWNLLWFGAIAVALLGARSLLDPAAAPLTVTLGIGLLFLFFGFAFTNAALWVEDQSTVNRATLHIAPLLVVWMVIVYREWAARLGAKPGDATAMSASAAA